MAVLQNRKVRVGVGIAAVVIALGAIGAATYAAFFDTEAGPNGTVASGTLDLTVGGGGTAELLNVQNIQPGFTQDATYTLTNIGSLPGTLTSTLTVVGSDVTCSEPEAEAEGVAAGACAAGGNLQDQLTVSVISGPGITTPTAPVTITQFAAGGLPSAGTLAPNATTTYGLRFAFPNINTPVNNPTNNRAQGDRVVLTSNFLLTQL